MFASSAGRTLLKMGWDDRRKVWITTLIKRHFEKSPTCAPAEAARLRDKEHAKQTRLVGNMMQSGAESCGPAVQHMFALSSEERALNKVMRNGSQFLRARQLVRGGGGR